MMYPNLEAELARRNMTRKEIAVVLGVNVCTVTPKLNDPKRLKYCEVVQIRNTLFPNLSVDYLFATERLS